MKLLLLGQSCLTPVANPPTITLSCTEGTILFLISLIASLTRRLTDHSLKMARSCSTDDNLNSCTSLCIMSNFLKPPHAYTFVFNIQQPQRENSLLSGPRIRLDSWHQHFLSQEWITIYQLPFPFLVYALSLCIRNHAWRKCTISSLGIENPFSEFYVCICKYMLYAYTGGPEFTSHRSAQVQHHSLLALTHVVLFRITEQENCSRSNKCSRVTSHKQAEKWYNEVAWFFF